LIVFPEYIVSTF